MIRSCVRKCVRTYVNHDSNAYVHTYVRVQVHHKRLKSVDGGVASLEKRGSETTGRYLRTYERTYLRTYLRGNGGAAVAASRGAVLGEDKSALPSLSTPGTSCRTPASFVALMPKNGRIADKEEHALSSGLGFFVAHYPPRLPYPSSFSSSPPRLSTYVRT